MRTEIVSIDATKAITKLVHLGEGRPTLRLVIEIIDGGATVYAVHKSGEVIEDFTIIDQELM